MMTLPTRSPLTIDVQTSGGVSVTHPDGSQAANVDVVQERGIIRDWLSELCLPKDWEALERMAQPTGFSTRRMRFVVGDESPTRLLSGARLSPQRWTYARYGQLLTLSHLGLVVGILHGIGPGLPDEVVPHRVEGHFLIGAATFYDSPLARAAWIGIKLGIFQHVSAILIRPQGDPLGGAWLQEVGLTDDPGCPGARILSTWED